MVIRRRGWVWLRTLFGKLQRFHHLLLDLSVYGAHLFLAGYALLNEVISKAWNRVLLEVFLDLSLFALNLRFAGVVPFEAVTLGHQ